MGNGWDIAIAGLAYATYQLTLGILSTPPPIRRKDRS